MSHDDIGCSDSEGMKNYKITETCLSSHESKSLKKTLTHQYTITKLPGKLKLFYIIYMEA